MGWWKTCQSSCQGLDSSSSSAVVKDLLDTSRRRPEHNLDYDFSSRQTTTIITTPSSPRFEEGTTTSEPSSPLLIIPESVLGVGHQDQEKPQSQQERRDQTSGSLRPEDIFQETSRTKEHQLLKEDNVDSHVEEEEEILALTTEQRMVCDSFHGSSSSVPSLNDSSHSLTSTTRRSRSKPQQQQHHHHPNTITIEEPATDSRIQFGRIHIREFPMTVGDSPSTTRGVPITMDWNPRAEYDLRLNDFEEIRPTLLRRTVAELQMSSLDRLRLLKAESSSLDSRTTSMASKRTFGTQMVK